jgi:hypothetical protein
MARDACDGCNRRVRIGGGEDTLWTFHEGPGGLSLELADGSEQFLCFDCMDRLPDDRTVTREDVAALSEREREADDR